MRARTTEAAGELAEQDVVARRRRGDPAAVAESVLATARVCEERPRNSRRRRGAAFSDRRERRRLQRVVRHGIVRRRPRPGRLDVRSTATLAFFCDVRAACDAAPGVEGDSRLELHSVAGPRGVGRRERAALLDLGLFGGLKGCIVLFSRLDDILQKTHKRHKHAPLLQRPRGVEVPGDWGLAVFVQFVRTSLFLLCERVLHTRVRLLPDREHVLFFARPRPRRPGPKRVALAHRVLPARRDRPGHGGVFGRVGRVWPVALGRGRSVG
mmetsp:Transcript_2361/g.8561  ORF Transcript_2361/g.8561 Transcript_2361/m.8561 type:complete len:268 (-) Transcript_2361:282-1085(-)